MTIQEAIERRHSVRQYENRPLDKSAVLMLKERIDSVNAKADLHIQLVTDEPKAFGGGMAKYGKFEGVTNYLVIAGRKTKDLERNAGYYGEEIVLLAQSLGISSCWVGLTYKRIDEVISIGKDEKIVCYISLGYGKTEGVQHRSKNLDKVSNISMDSPEWFKKGVESAILCPTAVNQQKYYFKHVHRDGKDYVIPEAGHSLVGYTGVDLGIAMYHFEVGAGVSNFTWL